MIICFVCIKKKEFNSYSTLTKSDIGFNKIELDQFLYFKINGSSKINKISYIEDKTNFIRVVNGPQANYFFPKINIFYTTYNVNQ